MSKTSMEKERRKAISGIFETAIYAIKLQEDVYQERAARTRKDLEDIIDQPGVIRICLAFLAFTDSAREWILRQQDREA